MTLDICASIVTYRCNIGQLRRAVASFQAQTINGHLSLIDNDSGNDYVASLKQFDGAQLIEAGANGGYGFGHNIGIKAAPAHRYYLVMNPDVVIHDGTLATMIAHMDANPDVALLLPRVQYPDGRLQPLNKRLPNVLDFFIRRFVPSQLHPLPQLARRLERYEMRDVGYERPCDVPFPSGCFMLFRAAALAKIQGFDERFFMYLEDCDIGRRIAEHGRIVYLPDAVITHHWTRGAHHNWRLTWQFIRSMFLYYQKWGWKWV
jgi:GT2 family glycosyltransferase